MDSAKRLEQLSVEVEAPFLGRWMAQRKSLGLCRQRRWGELAANLQVSPDRFGIHGQTELSSQRLGDNRKRPASLPEGANQRVVRSEFAAGRLCFSFGEKVANFLFEVHTQRVPSTRAVYGSWVAAFWLQLAVCGGIYLATLPPLCQMMPCRGSSWQVF